jgi:hypothetical protein
VSLTALACHPQTNARAGGQGVPARKRRGRPREILELMPAMSGTPFEVTAETIHPCQVAYVRGDDFLRFVAKHPSVYKLRHTWKSYSEVRREGAVH